MVLAAYGFRISIGNMTQQDNFQSQLSLNQRYQMIVSAVTTHALQG